MSTESKKIDSTIEAWENGQLGRDEAYVEKAKLDDFNLDESLALQMISIRLQKSLLEDLKNISQIRGIGYQPLIKQVLKRFVDAEVKMILREKAAEELKQQEQESANQERIAACG
ncbi:CopG family antitoxin [Enterovibrio baiacu]|uniref:CopG family antitoxin n=1 Tax=Enterovibrio baiacu TaxID=2491023 RepID=UPI001010E6EC|nr:CopG family antitoxin [Enterovibrio baiacu]MBE1276332.1 hypothetical protein [Enterovibrio baiacu]